MVDREKIVQTALNEVGTKSGSKYTQKYNELTASALPLDCDWCATFVTWVLNECGVTSDEFLHFKGCATAVDWLKERGIFESSKSYIPKTGDIIFFEYNPENNGTPYDDGSDHVGIVRYYSKGFVYTVEGNHNGVDIWCYDASSTKILGYGSYNEVTSNSDKYEIHYGKEIISIVKNSEVKGGGGYIGEYGTPLTMLSIESDSDVISRYVYDVKKGVEGITVIQIGSDVPIRYRVHNIGREKYDWCPWVKSKSLTLTDFSNDNDYAGNIGALIDCVQVELI